MRERNWQEVIDIYRKTALNNLVIGSWFFICIYHSLDSFFQIIPQFVGGKPVMVLLGLGILFNMLTGEHRGIILNSHTTDLIPLQMGYWFWSPSFLIIG